MYALIFVLIRSMDFHSYTIDGFHARVRTVVIAISPSLYSQASITKCCNGNTDDGEVV
jgi:hypothetical protein